MPKQEIIDWLNSLPDGAEVGVDEGGLCLRVETDEVPYLEIGGLRDARR
jgi:hypothetical protein